MISMVNHTSFTVENLEPMVKFYETVFGLGPTDIGGRSMAFTSAITGVEGAEITVAYMRGPNCAVELIKYTGGQGEAVRSSPNNPGSAHVCFNVPDFKATLQAALAAGGSMKGSPSPVMAGPNAGRMVAYIKDPEGNNIELIADQLEDSR